MSMRQIGFRDLDIDLVIDHGIDPDRGEAGMAARVGIERARSAPSGAHPIPSWPSHKALCPFTNQRRALDAGFFTIRDLDHLDH